MRENQSDYICHSDVQCHTSTRCSMDGKVSLLFYIDFEQRMGLINPMRTYPFQRPPRETPVPAPQLLTYTAWLQGVPPYPMPQLSVRGKARCHAYISLNCIVNMLDRDRFVAEMYSLNTCRGDYIQTDEACDPGSSPSGIMCGPPTNYYTQQLAGKLSPNPRASDTQQTILCCGQRGGSGVFSHGNTRWMAAR